MMSSKCYKSAIMTLFLLPFRHGPDCKGQLNMHLPSGWGSKEYGHSDCRRLKDDRPGSRHREGVSW